MFRLLAASLIMLLPLSAASADTLNPVEQAALQARIDAHEVARVEGNIRVLMAEMPPKVIPTIARQTGSTVPDVRAMVEGAIRQAYAQQDFQSIELDLSAAQFAETNTGLAYLLIPTETVVIFQDKTYQLNSFTLAFQDSGAWYLSRVAEGAPLKTLRLAYPEFEDVSFPQGSSTVIQD
ncbi:hypothetical protein [uncultured Roseobacter sp.]|uniref:hypothetical protein n=1 Tax=uncultured Roseobacter sp. TaxID=114847 RepID=UPI00263472B8|nr:hypothetical protein [uncultured Roseobacter sp.]